MTLPELPSPAIQTTAFSRDNSTQGYYTKSQMLALRAATVEACAQKVESGVFGHGECADAIRGCHE